MGEVPENWREENVTPIFKKKDPGSYRPINLTLMPRKGMEQVNLETISRHMEDEKVIGRSQHGFPKGEVMLD